MENGRLLPNAVVTKGTSLGIVGVARVVVLLYIKENVYNVWCC